MARGEDEVDPLEHHEVVGCKCNLGVAVGESRFNVITMIEIIIHNYSPTDNIILHLTQRFSFKLYFSLEQRVRNVNKIEKFVLEFI